MVSMYACYRNSKQRSPAEAMGLLGVCVAMVGTLGCGVLGPDRDLVIARLDAGEYAIELPDTVTAGSSAPLTINTVGSRYCVEVARTDVEPVDDRTVVVTPWNYVRTSGFCDNAPWVHAHHVELQMTRAGSHRVIVRGRVGNVVESFERTVVVR